MPFDQLKYINGYNREHYASVSVRLDKDKVAAFRAECAKNGDSVRKIVEDAIDRYMDGKKKVKYLFPAVFENDGNAYSVYFPDIAGCYTAGETLQEAFDMYEGQVVE